MELRKFTTKGLRKFENHYNQVCDKTKTPEEFDTSQYLTDNNSTVISDKVHLPEGPFITRYDLGVAITEALGDYVKNYTDILMWSWLGCYYFDTIFTTPKGGLQLGEPANVILNDNSRRRFRHKVFGPAYFVNEFSSSASAILNKHPQIAGDIYENISGRHTLLSISFLGIMKKVMWNDAKGDWKHGAASRKPQGANGIGKLLKQLAVNNFILFCESPESQDALIEKFPPNQRP